MDSDGRISSATTRPLAATAAVFDAAYYRGVLLEHAATAVVLAALYAAGLSHRLAEGVARLTGGRWWLANALYLAVMILGIVAVVFPIHHARARRLVRALNTPDRNDAGWLGLYARAILTDAALAFAFFNATYALLHWTPHRWWIIAAALYTALAIALPALLSRLVIPRLYQPRAMPHAELERALRETATRAGHVIEGVGVWSEDDGAHFPDVVLAGRRRHFLIVSAFVERQCALAEACALVAQEIGRAKQHQLFLRVALGSALAMAGFAAVHYGALEALRRIGPVTIAEARDLTGFPLLALAILAASALVQPLLRLQRRGQDFAADAFAARTVGAPAIRSALQRTHGAAPPQPRWQELLFGEHPSLPRRLARLSDGALPCD